MLGYLTQSTMYPAGLLCVFLCSLLPRRYSQLVGHGCNKTNQQRTQVLKLVACSQAACCFSAPLLEPGFLVLALFLDIDGRPLRIIHVRRIAPIIIKKYLLEVRYRGGERVVNLYNPCNGIYQAKIKGQSIQRERHQRNQQYELGGFPTDPFCVFCVLGDRDHAALERQIHLSPCVCIAPVLSLFAPVHIFLGSIFMWKPLKEPHKAFVTISAITLHRRVLLNFHYFGRSCASLSNCIPTLCTMRL